MSNKRKIWVLRIKNEKKNNNKTEAPVSFELGTYGTQAQHFIHLAIEYFTNTRQLNFTNVNKILLIKQNVVRSGVSHLVKMCYSALILEF